MYRDFGVNPVNLTKPLDCPRTCGKMRWKAWVPGTDGIELMQNVPELAELPVIFISGYGRDETIARALEAGAADYIVKPFSPTELTARIRAALRRRADSEPFVLGDLAIDYDRRLVTMAGREVELTATEYELLRALALNAPDGSRPPRRC